MHTAEAAKRWADAWLEAWVEHDPEALAPVYAEGAVFRSHPFREPEDPLEYARWAFADERSAEPRFGEPVVADDRALVEWWATVVDNDGAKGTLAGCSLIRFGSDGRVVEQRDYWAMQEGHQPPHEHWGVA